jgi:hypothetical protein
MKRVLISAIVVTAIAFTACAQKIDASKVPDAVKVSFAKQFPGATARWEKEEGKYEAGFKLNGNTMSAVFEANGKMAESEMDMKVSDLPPTIFAYIKEHYKGKNITRGAKVTMADGTINYEAEIEGKDVIFDADGKFLKEVKD